MSYFGLVYGVIGYFFDVLRSLWPFLVEDLVNEGRLSDRLGDYDSLKC